MVHGYDDVIRRKCLVPEGEFVHPQTTGVPIVTWNHMTQGFTLRLITFILSGQRSAASTERFLFTPGMTNTWYYSLKIFWISNEPSVKGRNNQVGQNEAAIPHHFPCHTTRAHMSFHTEQHQAEFPQLQQCCSKYRSSFPNHMMSKKCSVK